MRATCPHAAPHTNQRSVCSPVSQSVDIYFRLFSRLVSISPPYFGPHQAAVCCDYSYIPLRSGTGVKTSVRDIAQGYTSLKAKRQASKLTVFNFRHNMCLDLARCLVIRIEGANTKEGNDWSGRSHRGAISRTRCGAAQPYTVAAPQHSNM